MGVQTFLAVLLPLGREEEEFLRGDSGRSYLARSNFYYGRYSTGVRTPERPGRPCTSKCLEIRDRTTNYISVYNDLFIFIMDTQP